METLELKIELMTKGINIPKSVRSALVKKIGKKFYNDDYVTTTGIMLELDHDMFVTANIKEDSPYTLKIEKDSMLIESKEKDVHADCKLWAPSGFMVKKEENEFGLLTDDVNAHFDRARISPVFGCNFHCQFCSWNQSVYKKNSIEAMVKAFEVAIKDERVTHVLISGGTPKEEDLPWLTEVYEYFCKHYKKYDFDVMMTPRGFDSFTDESQYEGYLKYLKKAGVHGLSINIELFNNKICQKYCKEKHAIGIDRYLKFLKLAGKIFGATNVRSGLIVGLESQKDTLKAVEEICKCGCMPMLSPYAPYNGIGKAPTTKQLLKVYKEAIKICEKYKIPLGPTCQKCRHNTL